MRYFVAIDVNDQVKERIVKLQQELSALIDGPLTPPQNLHFTLKFLGELNTTQVDNVSKILSHLTYTPLNINLTSVGTFPSSTFVRVVWVGAPELYNLQKAVCDALISFGKEESIIPHLTIARVTNVKNKENLNAFLKRHENMGFGTFTVSALKLKKSTLTAGGPIYEDVTRYDF